MFDLLIDSATSTLTKINELEVSIKCCLNGNQIRILDLHCPDNDITNVIIGDDFILEYRSEVGLKSIVKVDSIKYQTITGSLPEMIIIKFSKNKINNPNQNMSNVTNHNYNAPNQNIAINSSDFQQTINIDQSLKNDPEVRSRLLELEKAILEKNNNKVLEITKFLFDKGFDVGVTVLGAYFTR